MDQSLDNATHETSVAKVIETTKTYKNRTGREGRGEREREREGTVIIRYSQVLKIDVYI